MLSQNDCENRALQKFSQFGGRLKLWDRVQFLERRRERIRETPDRPRAELLVPWLEVQIVHSPREMFWRLEFALNERLVDRDLGGNVCQFELLPRLHLIPHRLEIPLHAIHADRDAIDERKRLRVFSKHRCKRTGDNVSLFRMPSESDFR